MGSCKSPNVKFAQFRLVILSAIGPMQCARGGEAGGGAAFVVQLP